MKYESLILVLFIIAWSTAYGVKTVRQSFMFLVQGRDKVKSSFS